MIIILGIVQDKCEVYDNLRELLTNLKLNGALDYVLAADLKVCNVMAGIGSHSSTYPCTWCYATSPYTKSAKSRTLGDTQDYYKDYVTNGRKNAPKYFNCIYEPLIKGKATDEMIDLIPPPSLHLLIGVEQIYFGQIMIGGHLGSVEQ